MAVLALGSLGQGVAPHALGPQPQKLGSLGIDSQRDITYKFQDNEQNIVHDKWPLATISIGSDTEND